MYKRLPLCCALLFSFASITRAYGPLGHQIVGAIADQKLTNTPTGEKVKALLDGLTLGKSRRHSG